MKIKNRVVICLLQLTVYRKSFGRVKHRQLKLVVMLESGQHYGE